MLRTGPAYIFVAVAFLYIVFTLTGGWSPTRGSKPSLFKTTSKSHNAPKTEWAGSPQKTTFYHVDDDEHSIFPEKHEHEHEHEQTYEPYSDPLRGDAQTIPHLIKEAGSRFSNFLASQSQTVEEAAEAYRKRRGRHPPPGFDLWFEYAQENDAIIVEEFWDQIYHDLEPFWAIDPALIRAQARALGMAVMVKDGHSEIRTDWFWHVIWRKMVEEVAFMLPDMVIPMNSMDEPRMMVPWANMTEYITTAKETRRIVDRSSVRREVQGWGEEVEEPAPELPFVEWSKTAPYSFAREACHPNSPIRGDSKLFNSGTYALPSEPSTHPMSSHMFVENSTLWSDTCQDPAIAAYHGALISPNSASTCNVLQPLFGGSKFSTNNDILLPAPMYWNGEERFEQDDATPWSQKTDTVIWRGTATGGRHNALNWPHFHRHRFVALANGTKYAEATKYDRIFTPAQLQASVDPLPKQLQQNLDTWLDRRNNIAFTDLFCDMSMPQWGTCWYLDDVYGVAPGLNLSEQYTNKFLPDIDGNSFSGRYRSFLQSSSVPMKATLYREWHDSRLIAWKHFVPMTNRFTDYYALLAYFMGCESDICGKDAIEGHDSEAEAIAEAGSEWSKKVLRKVDMQIYIARLLLEYGRITDDNREVVGWIDDLETTTSSQGESDVMLDKSS